MVGIFLEHRNIGVVCRFSSLVCLTASRAYTGTLCVLSDYSIHELLITRKADDSYGTKNASDYELCHQPLSWTVNHNTGYKVQTSTYSYRTPLVGQRRPSLPQVGLNQITSFAMRRGL
jgi:hypothetical protein